MWCHGQNIRRYCGCLAVNLREVGELGGQTRPTTELAPGVGQPAVLWLWRTRPLRRIMPEQLAQRSRRRQYVTPKSILPGKRALAVGEGQPTVAPREDPEELTSQSTDQVLHDCMSVLLSGNSYVSGAIPNLVGKVSMLVDTGSSITLMRYAFFSQIPKHPDIVIYPTVISIKSVNGSAMKVYGSAVLPLKIGALSVSHEFILADIVPDVLLGNDLLRQHSCIVDYSNNALVVGDNCAPMSDATPYVLSSEVSHSEPYVSCHVALCQAITVPGYSQIISRLVWIFQKPVVHNLPL